MSLCVPLCPSVPEGSVTGGREDGTVHDDPDTNILHADLDAFYASVEQLRDPTLRGLPVAVGGGVVLAASYEARRFGIRSGMSGRSATRLCPHLTFVPPTFTAYSEASRQVRDIFNSFTPLVEPLSPDEAFLDVAGSRRLFGDPVSIGRALRERVRTHTGLAISVGVARTKFLAKVASRVAKPDGMLVVAPATESHFLHPLPVEHLWGVGPATAARLRRYGIARVADLLALPDESVERIVGRSLACHLLALSRHVDMRRVDPNRRRGSVGCQRALGEALHDPTTVQRILLQLADRVGSRMRRDGWYGRTVSVRVRNGEFESTSRSHTLTVPTDSTAVINGVAQTLVNRAPHAAVRLLAVSVSGLERPASLQLELPMPGSGRTGPNRLGAAPARTQVERAVDGVRERFGRHALRNAALL